MVATVTNLGTRFSDREQPKNASEMGNHFVENWVPILRILQRNFNFAEALNIRKATYDIQSEQQDFSESIIFGFQRLELY